MGREKQDVNKCDVCGRVELIDHLESCWLTIKVSWEGYTGAGHFAPVLVCGDTCAAKSFEIDTLGERQWYKEKGRNR